MEHFVATGRFPSSDFTPEQLAGSSTKGFIEVGVRTRYPWELLKAFLVVGAAVYAWVVARRMWTWALCMLWFGHC